MQTESLLDRLVELKDRFKSFFQHKKKVAALENFSETDKFCHRTYLDLVKHCMNQGFLGDKESDFLDHMLNRYEINYLQWSHKTRWIKQQISQNRTSRAETIQQVFPFSRQHAPVHVPIEILGNVSVASSKRV